MVSLDTVFASYDYVPLETNEQCIIGNVTELIPCKDCYCILDRDNDNVFIFESNGRFRCKLGSTGHGPKEHIDAWNVAYNEETEMISLLDLSGRKLQQFDLYGNIHKEQPIYLLFTDFEFLNGDMVLYTGTSSNLFTELFDLFQLVVVDSLWTPLSRGCKATEAMRDEFCYSGVLHKFDQKVLYDDLLSDTLWSVTQNCISPFVALNIEGKHSFNQYEKLHMTDELYRDRTANTARVSGWFVTPDYIAVAYSAAGVPRISQSVIYSRRTGSSKLLGPASSPKRLGDCLASAYIDAVLSDDTFVKIVQPSSIAIAIGNNEIRNGLTPEEKKMAFSISTDDNPILLIEKLIDF